MNSASEDRLAALQALVTLSRIDISYSDRYLVRADTLLRPHYARERYRAEQRRREQIPRLVKALRQAADAGDWKRVRKVAAEAGAVRTSDGAAGALLPIAQIVYEPRTIGEDATALGLLGIVARAQTDLARARTEARKALRCLLDADPEWSRLYRARADHFEALHFVEDDLSGPVLDRRELEKRLRQSVEKQDFAGVQRLAEALGTAAAPANTRPRARVEMDRDRLAAPFPTSHHDTIADLGLRQENLPAVTSLNSYLSCCCAERTTFPDQPLSETRRGPQGCTCGHQCPPEVSSVLKENLDLLLIHPFITSAGTRYLPWFGAECLLVETFPETDSGAMTPLLRALGLPRRRGLTRAEIEDATRTRSSDLCDELGLDADDFTVSCIPFDAYFRLAGAYEWGRQRLWTHLDGYQVTKELHLRALVGGDEHYGGREDLCAVNRDYDADRITARFCVVRRDRFGVR